MSRADWCSLTWTASTRWTSTRCIPGSWQPAILPVVCALTTDDKGLCFCLDPNKTELFYAEKVRSGLKVFRIELSDFDKISTPIPKQVFEIEEAQIVNMAVVDDSNLFVLFNRNAKAHFRLINLKKAKYEETCVSEEYRGDHMAVSSELGLVVVSCVQPTKAGCINHLKFYDLSVSKTVGDHKLMVPKPDGKSLIMKEM